MLSLIIVNSIYREYPGYSSILILDSPDAIGSILSQITSRTDIGIAQSFSSMLQCLESRELLYGERILIPKLQEDAERAVP